VKQERVIRSAGVVGGFTLLSRLLGLCRDVLMAAFFGTSPFMSAFVVAFTLPNLFRRLFGEGALSAAFIPVFVETLQEKGRSEAWKLANQIITLTATVLLSAIAIGYLLIYFSCDSVSSQRISLILALLTVMLPYMLFICLAALSMAILNSFQHFAVPAATPCLLNMIWIGAMLFLFPLIGPSLYQRIFVVACAVLIGGIAQLVVQIPVLKRFGYRPTLNLNVSDRHVNRVLMLMGPAALALAITQFNVLIDRLLATLISDWAPAALFFSERLIYLPLGIFATAFSTVLLPTFSSLAAGRRYDEVRTTINHSLRVLLFIMIPAATGLLVLAHPIISMLFQRNAFTQQSTNYTAIALQCYAPGLVVFSLAKIFVPVFYSMQDTKTPLKIGVITVLLNLVINVIFILTLPLRFKHAGIAGATVIAEAFYACTLAFLLHKRIGSPGWTHVITSALKMLAAAIIMGVTAWYSIRLIPPLFSGSSFPPLVIKILSVFSSILLAILVYFASAILLQCQEWKELIKGSRIK